MAREKDTETSGARTSQRRRPTVPPPVPPEAQRPKRLARGSSAPPVVQATRAERVEKTDHVKPLDPDYHSTSNVIMVPTKRSRRWVPWLAAGLVSVGVGFGAMRVLSRPAPELFPLPPLPLVVAAPVPPVPVPVPVPVPAPAPAAAPTPAPAVEVKPEPPAPVVAPVLPANIVRIPVTSTPSGATVSLVDDEGSIILLGKTPLSVAVDPARGYDLVLAFKGHRTAMTHIAPLPIHELAIALAPTSAPAPVVVPRRVRRPAVAAKPVAAKPVAAKPVAKPPLKPKKK